MHYLNLLHCYNYFLIFIKTFYFLIAFHSKPYSFNTPNNSKYLLN